MTSEKEIEELAYKLWEEEGRPEGKSEEHYYRAKKILEEREAASAMRPASKPAGFTSASKASPNRRRQ